MINFKQFVVLLVFAAMVGCGGSESQPGADQSQAAPDSALADSIVDDLEKTSQELKSLSDEAQKAIDDLSEEN